MKISAFPYFYTAVFVEMYNHLNLFSERLICLCAKGLL